MKLEVAICVGILGFCLVTTASAQANRASQPALISDEIIGNGEGDWGPVIEWIQRNVPSENFDELATMNTSMAVWVDSGSLVRTGSNVKAWVHIEIFSEEGAQAAGFRSMMLLHEYRCDTRQQRQLAGASYSGTDRSGIADEFNESRPSAWRFIRPDQIDDEILNAACNGTRIFDGTAVQ
ncbi:MAG: surface-adhesin E family protein [Brevundimonas sp.]|uniref:surface-adhesin E family protein n=1 Tax=Brevundimonas sp. TaxID=1871086 RepID=UPI00391A8A52